MSLIFFGSCLRAPVLQILVDANRSRKCAILKQQCLQELDVAVRKQQVAILYSEKHFTTFRLKKSTDSPHLLSSPLHEKPPTAIIIFFPLEQWRSLKFSDGGAAKIELTLIQPTKNENVPKLSICCRIIYFAVDIQTFFG